MNVQLALWWPLLEMAQDQVVNRDRPHSTHPQCGLHRHMQVGELDDPRNRRTCTR